MLLTGWRSLAAGSQLSYSRDVNNIQIRISIPNTAVCCVNEMRLFGHETSIACGGFEACDRACLLCAEDSVKAIDPGDIFIQIYP